MSQAHRRLTDLLAGWSRYLDGCAESARTDPSLHVDVTAAEYEAESLEVAALYQSVGVRDELTPEECRAVVLEVLHVLTEGTRAPEPGSPALPKPL